MVKIKTIEKAEYDNLLVLSTSSRSDCPDGNIYFDLKTREIEMITRQELPIVGKQHQKNMLDEKMGITFEALWHFEIKMRRLHNKIRCYERMIYGHFCDLGVYFWLHKAKFSTQRDVALIRDIPMILKDLKQIWISKLISPST